MEVVQPEDFEELKEFISQVVEYDTQDFAYRL